MTDAFERSTDGKYLTMTIKDDDKRRYADVAEEKITELQAEKKKSTLGVHQKNVDVC